MSERFDPLARDPLAQRLQLWQVAVPDIPEAIRKAHGRTVRRQRGPVSHRLAFAGAACALAVILMSATAFANTLANLTRDALRAAGLTAAQVSPAAGAAENDGFKVVVTGAYADQISTVVFAELDEPCAAMIKSAPPRSTNCTAGFGNGGPYLTDQFGHRYTVTGGGGVDVGAYPIFFQPLTAQAASAGARLTLHVPYVSRNGAVTSELTTALSGALSPSAMQSMPPPAPIIDQARGVTYNVVSVEYSGTYLQVRTRFTGNLRSVITHIKDANGAGESWPGVFIDDGSGKYLLPLAGSVNGNWMGMVSANPHQEPQPDYTVQDETRIFALKRGTYHLVVAAGPDARSKLASWTLAVR